MSENKPIIAPPPLDNGPKYGLHRHHSPRRYTCAHAGCERAASTLARAGEHDVVGIDGVISARTHNCCGGTHEPNPQTSTEKD